MSDYDWRVGPQEGDGATYHIGSDSYAYTVVLTSNEKVKRVIDNPDDRSQRVEVEWPKWILVTRDDTRATKELKHWGDTQEYAYKSNYRLQDTAKYILHKDGRYRKATSKRNSQTGQYEFGNTAKKTASTINVGYRKEYMDPHF